MEQNQIAQDLLLSMHALQDVMVQPALGFSGSEKGSDDPGPMRTNRGGHETSASPPTIRIHSPAPVLSQVWNPECPGILIRMRFLVARLRVLHSRDVSAANPAGAHKRKKGCPRQRLRFPTLALEGANKRWQCKLQSPDT